MLRLVGTQKPDVSYSLLVDVKYTVGRKLGDITFPDDHSVSRVHAEVVVEHPAGNINEPLLTPVLGLTDIGSKFGTYATEDGIKSKSQINSREQVTLSVGDKLRFGLQWNEFKVDYTPFVVTSSSFRPTSEFKANIVKLGGHFVNEWNSYVTHVVMESLTLTVKAVCALLAAKPIVTPAYITDLVSAFETRKTPPDANTFQPPVGEKGMADLDESFFQPKPSRTTLFAGKTFLFCTSKHLKKIAVAIEAGGGNAKLINDAANENILSNEFIIMGHPLDVADGEKDGRVKAVLDIYKNGGKRFIADSEIGLAAVYNSIEKHCNPKSSINSAILPHITTQTQSSGSSSAPLVPETQEAQVGGNSESSVCMVNETVIKHEGLQNKSSEQSCKASRGDKRTVEESGPSSKKRSADDALCGSPKRIKDVSSSSSLSRSCWSKSSTEQKSKASHARILNSLFNLSSDEDEDVCAVPETQPDPTIVDIDDAEVEVVPDSQIPQVNLVDVRNLQSLESIPVRPECGSFRVPTSPVNVPPSQEMIRNSGTDFIETVTTSVMNAITLPAVGNSADGSSSSECKNAKKNTKRPLKSTSKAENLSAEEGPSRKRHREEDESHTLVDKTKKISLNDQSWKVEENGVVSGPSLPVIRLPLMNQNLNRDVSRNAINESNVSNESVNRRNFKTFSKVLPVVMSRQASRSNISTNSSKGKEKTHGGCMDTSMDTKPVKLMAYEYNPRPHRSFCDILPLDGPRERPPTPEGFQPFQSSVEPELARETNARDKNKQESEGRRNLNTLASRNQEQPSTSGRRTSPRKKGPNIKLPAALPTVPPMIQSDDEEEEDMWSFNQ